MVSLRLHGESNVRAFIIYLMEKFQSILFVVEWTKGVIHISTVEINCRTIVLLEQILSWWPMKVLIRRHTALHAFLQRLNATQISL